MIYYDRRLPDDFARELLPEGALGWLVDFVRNDPQARLEFRRADGDRVHGAIEVYVGRARPLELVNAGQGSVKLVADKKNRAVSPGLFETQYQVATLPGAAMKQHLEACRSEFSANFTEGEAVAHAGLMRRYGPEFLAAHPVLAVDSEARLGFRGDNVYPTGTPHKDELEKQARIAVGLPEAERFPLKLDAVGVLRSLDIGLVEVKKQGGDIVRAAWQAAVHLFAFCALTQQDDYSLVDVVNGMIQQKVYVGLLPSEVRFAHGESALVPIIAGPETFAERWPSAWLTKLDPVLKKTSYLTGLRLWRLSPDGFVEQEHIV